MPTILRSHRSSATMVAVLLALATTSVGAAATGYGSIFSLSAHATRASLPTLRLDGGPPRALDNLWLGYNDLFLEVNASLTHILPSGKVAPDLATWTISKNHLVYTFTIRNNARFSNGHDVTALDAVFSLKRFLTPSLGSAGLAYFGLIRGAAAFNAGKTKGLSGVKVLGRRTLQITITKPAGYFPMALADYSAVFDPPVVAGKPLGNPRDHFRNGYLSTACTANQGAGPFRFVCHDGSSTIHSFYSGTVPRYTVVPNPFYYGHKPRIRIEYRAHPDNLKAYQAGQIDTSYALPPIADRRPGKNSQYHQFPSSAIQYLMPNVHVAPFDNVHCRLAVAYAIDRSAVTRRALDSIQRPTYAVVPEGMLGYYPGNDNPHYNLSRATSELARCPERTTRLVLTYPDMGPSSRNQGASIASMLAHAGFNVKLELISALDWDAVVTHPLDQSKTQLVLGAWAQDYSDPQDFVGLLLRSGQRFNVGEWHDAAFDRLVDRADGLLNPKKRASLYIQAQHIALSQGAFISLSSQIGFAQVKPYVHGLVGTEAYNWLMPKNFDWANVAIDKH